MKGGGDLKLRDEQHRKMSTKNVQTSQDKSGVVESGGSLEEILEQRKEVPETIRRG